MIRLPKGYKVVKNKKEGCVNYIDKRGRIEYQCPSDTNQARKDLKLAIIIGKNVRAFQSGRA